MSYYSPSIEKLIENFERLPSIGHKTAARLAFYILNCSENETQEFIKSIIDAKKNLKYCSKCYNISDTDPCFICNNAKRDQGTICVVEDVFYLFNKDKDLMIKGDLPNTISDSDYLSLLKYEKDDDIILDFHYLIITIKKINFIIISTISPANLIISSVKIFSSVIFLNSKNIITNFNTFSNLFLFLIYLYLSVSFVLVDFFIKLTIFSKSFDKYPKIKSNL